MKMIPFILILLSSFSLKAQTWDELFRQRKTQHKYMLQQIAGLKIYIEAAQKGYAILRDGLNTVGRLKDGDLKLHRFFFDGLKDVNPKIKAAGRIPELLKMNAEIKNSNIRTLKLVSELTPSEVEYIKRVFTRTTSDKEDIIDQTTLLITNGELEMSDDQRIKQLNNLYEQMQSIYLFTRSFGDEIGLLIAQRKRELININNSLLINGINH